MNSESDSKSVQREHWRREIARAVEQQRALKRERREAWSAARDAPEPTLRCRELAREVHLGAARVRVLLLACALVRGRPVWRQERRARDRSEPLVRAIAAAAGRPVPEVRAWIEQAAPEADRVDYEAHLEGVRARLHARRAARRAARESTS
ncbi:MAG: hypothetical protein J0L92_09015 [Deltaproteobacteria bacterium]|nr:hypothetical protein [Deltaproteobacteria bacterium]